MENQIMQEEDKDLDIIDKLFKNIKKDIKNLDNFWKKYKNTIFWILITFIVLQCVDILSLGADVSNTCQKSNIIQKGGTFQSFRTTGPLGNIFSKFGTIFQNAFKIIGVILLIAIIGFLPILVMIYLTYRILNYMVKKVRGL
jgi:hypothetical protein